MNRTDNRSSRELIRGYRWFHRVLSELMILVTGGVIGLIFAAFFVLTSSVGWTAILVWPLSIGSPCGVFDVLCPWLGGSVADEVGNRLIEHFLD
ncbi:MAG: hypothetical protein AAF333_06765 [Planctomycetota bacterium]